MQSDNNSMRDVVERHFTKPLRQQHSFLVLLGFFLFLANCICRSCALEDRPVVRKVNKRMSETLCDDRPLTNLESNMTLGYSVLCETLTLSDIALLQDGIMDAYNNLLQPQYCDPFSRRILNVTYVDEPSSAANNSSSQFVVVLFQVTGTCQGCDSSVIMSNMSFFGTLQDGVETSCPCPVDAVANRAATLDEFLTVYESILARDSQELICVTSTKTDSGGGDVVVPTEQPSAVPTVVGVDCPVNLSTQLISQLVVTLNENATQTSYEALGQDLIDTYNSLMNATYTTCQTTKYRQITNITIDWDSTFVGKRINGRQIQDILVPSQQEIIFYTVEGGCDGCAIEDHYMAPTILSQDDFVEYYSMVVDTGLDFFSEIVPVDCAFNTSRFDNAVIVEYVPESVDSEELLDNVFLMQQLEDIFVRTYNDIAREFCDPYGRQLTSAKIVVVGANNTVGNIPVEMELGGYCSNCDGLDLSAYDVPSSILTVANGPSNNTDLITLEDSPFRKMLESDSFVFGRVIQGGDSSCYCPAHPIGTRGVYETEFLDAYRKAIRETAPIIIEESTRQVELLDGLNQGLGLEVADCQFGTDFRTGFPFGLEGTSNPDDLTEEEKQQIVESLKQAIADLYRANDEEACNPDFRVIQIAELGVLTRPTRRRKLQQGTRAPAPAVSGSSQPISSQAPAPSPSSSQVPSAPVLSRPPANTGVVDFYIFVSGVCNGCENPITLDEQTVDSRRLQDEEEWFRRLQSEGTSNCFCPIGAVVPPRPTLNQLLTLFEANLRSVGLPYNILNFREARMVDCTVPLSQFQFQFQYTLLLEADVTADQVQAVGDLVMLTYNDISQDFCDPLDQRMESIALIDFQPHTGEVGQPTGAPTLCQEYNVNFQVMGRCRGCTNAGTLLSSSSSTLATRQLYRDAHLKEYEFRYPLKSFGNATFSTLRMSSNTSNMSSWQRNDCFCDGAVIAARPPNTEEFNNALAEALNDFQVTNVCSLPPNNSNNVLVPTAQPASTLSPTFAPTELPTVTPLTPNPA